MKIATFNINGVKARIETLSNWLQDSAPDVALLQEIKSVDEAFPREHFEDMGHRVFQQAAPAFVKGLGDSLVWPGLMRKLNRVNPGFDY